MAHQADLNYCLVSEIRDQQKIKTTLKVDNMDEFANLLREIYRDAYVQGRKDGLEGLYTEPQLALDSYLTDENVATKLSELGYFSELTLCASAAGLH